VVAPESIKTPESLSALRAWQPDLIAVVAYGQLLPAELLRIPPLGCVNLHASLLPKYRGAAPIAWAIARGETVTGVTTMLIDERMDAGDIIFQRETPIGAEDTAATLHDRLAASGGELLAETLAAIRRGKAPRRPQNEAEATFAPKLSKSDGRIDWSRAAAEICNRVRGFNPWPGCWFELPRGSGRSLRVWRAAVAAGGGAAPGTVLRAAGEWVIQAGADAVRILDLQPEGRRVMPVDAFLRGHAVREGESVG
jgi:methionyl-tRNA formyltransferase